MISIEGFPSFPPLTSDARRPSLVWKAVSELKVDHTYQRVIGRTTRKTIIKIAQNFDWAKFGIVIITPDGFIIDGQCRTHAAAIRAIKKVPCVVIPLHRAEAAEAFAAINHVRTSINSLTLHHARVVANDPEATVVNEVCEAAGVSVCRYPVPASEMKRGQTLAASTLYRTIRLYGRSTVEQALKMLMTCEQIGHIRRETLVPLCRVIVAEPSWVGRSLKNFDVMGAYRRSAGVEQRIGSMMVFFTEYFNGPRAA